MPKPFSKEFRDDVVRVARDREPGQTIKQIAADFGIAESCLRNWLRQADVEEGGTPSCARRRSGQVRCRPEQHPRSPLPATGSAGQSAGK
ncbi:transposase [Actinotalea caeni]|uniref:transposase n=1 Tax=Actinotalea caeni TaxID=1348467 RepID=UPI0019560A0D|nr:transposase [Actinotalea caeni]